MYRSILVGLAAVILTSCESAQNQTEMTGTQEKTGIVEITTFRLTPGVKVKDFKESTLLMQKEFLEKQNGFVKRTLTVSADSVWTDIVYWKDQQSAEKTMQLAEKSELALPFIEKIEFNSVKMNFTTPILTEE